MRISCRADDIRIYGEEDGWKLTIDTDEGATITVHIHHLAETLAVTVDSTIGEWLREGQAARAKYVSRITEEDLQAYDLSDPKRITLEKEMNA